MATSLSAQGPFGGFFSAKGEGSVTASYTLSRYDAFYLGEEKTEGVPAHDEISQNIYSLYAKYGITDDVTLVAILPYISASGDNMPDPVNGESKVSGLQDVSLWAKYRPFSAGFTGGRLDGLAAVGITVPGGYEPNGILSLGNGAFATDLKIGGHLNLDSGLFATAIGGYTLRGKSSSDLANFTNVEFDVPNSTNLLGKIGFASSSFYVEAWVYNQNTTDARDITDADFGGRFPETEVDFTSIGASVYVPVSTNLGLSIGYGTTIDGRNVGDASYFSGGVTLKFGR